MTDRCGYVHVVGSSSFTCVAAPHAPKTPRRRDRRQSTRGEQHYFVPTADAPREAS